MLRRFALLVVLALPVFAQDPADPHYIYSTRSFDDFNAAINFMIALPYEKRDTARFFQLQAPGGWYHVVCRGCDPEWGNRGYFTNATWWSPDAHAGAEFRKTCAQQWGAGRPCWYAEIRNETVLVLFYDAAIKTKPKPY